MALFRAKNVTKTYIDGVKEIEVLKDINLSIAMGEMTAIIGASGSGKTTLLQICGTLARPTSGQLHFDTEPLHTLTSQELSKFRNREIGFIFQFHHLLPEFTTLENVIMPALIAGRRRRSVSRQGIALLEQVELGHRLHQKINNLSGGEQQRAALARALMMNPRMLLADEPTGNLDSRSGNIVFDLLQRLCRENGMAVVMVTHNMELANRMDNRLTLRDGELHL